MVGLHIFCCVVMFRYLCKVAMYLIMRIKWTEGCKCILYPLAMLYCVCQSLFTGWTLTTQIPFYCKVLIWAPWVIDIIDILDTIIYLGVDVIPFVLSLMFSLLNEVLICVLIKVSVLRQMRWCVRIRLFESLKEGASFIGTICTAVHYPVYKVPTLE